MQSEGGHRCVGLSEAKSQERMDGLRSMFVGAKKALSFVNVFGPRPSISEIWPDEDQLKLKFAESVCEEGAIHLRSASKVPIWAEIDQIFMNITQEMSDACRKVAKDQ
eukprot:scaffold51184_cov20-Tisochrysis_lutea.AAC.5